MHKPRINGTAYDIVSGKIRIGGTAYNLRYGTERVSGSANKTSLGTDFANLMRDAVCSPIIMAAARNANTLGTVSLPVWNTASFPFYVFSVCDGEFSVNKVTSSPSTELLYQSSPTKGNLTLSQAVLNYSNTDGGRSSSVYGATLIAFNFPNYTEAEADAILSSISKYSGDGRNASTADGVGLGAIGQFDTLIATWYHSLAGVCFAVSSPLGTVVFSTSSGSAPVSNLPLIKMALSPPVGVAYLSSDGSEITTVYGGSIIKLAG